MTDYTTDCLFEHRFWLQILGEHAQFIRDGLGQSEPQEIAKAIELARKFDELLLLSRQPLTGQPLFDLTERAYRNTVRLREFKLHLLRRQLTGNLSLYLTASFLNHMVSELEEYLRITGFLLQGTSPPKLHPLDHHLLWLFDASFHCAAIPMYIDYTETNIIHGSRKFQREFEVYYLKAIEFAGYLRANIERFPALTRFNHEVNLEMLLFAKFLEEIKELELDGKLLSVFTAILPDHLAREEYYYLLKLSTVSEVPKPSGDPTRPRPNPA